MFKRKPQVVLWNNQPAPYVVDRCNIIAKRGNLDFEAWFSYKREEDRSWNIAESTWQFRARYIPQRSLLGWQHHIPLAELRTIKPEVMVSLYDRPAYTLGVLTAMAVGSQVAIDVLPNFDTWRKPSLVMEAGKHFLFRAVSGAEVEGPAGVEICRKYGLPSERTTEVLQSVDINQYNWAKDLDPVKRKQLREQLGLHGCVFIYVGRLLARKGLDYLFEAYKIVKAAQPNTCLLIVGDGLEEEHYRARAQDLRDVIFTGFVQTKDVPTYYALADVMVFPTMGDSYGYVVEEAMAVGLPVISSDAAGDIRLRIPQGEVGFVIPRANVNELVKYMLLLANDVDLCKQLGEKAATLVMNCSHERYAIEFEILVENLLRYGPRVNPANFIGKMIGHGLLTGSLLKKDRPGQYVGNFFNEGSPSTLLRT